MGAQMAADGGGLRRLFEKPMPENPTPLEALSAWSHRVHHPKKPIDTASFTEIFGELHFQEKPDHHRAVLLPSPPPCRPPPPRTTTSWAVAADEADKSKDDSSLDALLRPRPRPAGSGVKRSASFCVTKKGSSSASSLLLCTEGLGSESTVDADDMFKDADAEAEAAALGGRNSNDETDADAVEGAAEEEAKRRPPMSFPPPIRSIGRGGKPSVCFRAFRADGRFVLMEVVIPGKEILQAYREGGRLRLQFANAAAAAAAAAAGVRAGEEVHDGEDKRHAENAVTADS